MVASNWKMDYDIKKKSTIHLVLRISLQKNTLILVKLLSWLRNEYVINYLDISTLYFAEICFIVVFTITCLVDLLGNHLFLPKWTMFSNRSFITTASDQYVAYHLLPDIVQCHQMDHLFLVTTCRLRDDVLLCTLKFRQMNDQDWEISCHACLCYSFGACENVCFCPSNSNDHGWGIFDHLASFHVFSAYERNLLCPWTSPVFQTSALDLQTSRVDENACFFYHACEKSLWRPPSFFLVWVVMEPTGG